ncbi:hypothetical protein [Variovorax gossypii]|jgi:hypothetical protein
MDSKIIITIFLGALGGLATNLIYIAVFKFLFAEIYESAFRRHGLSGLKFRIAIAILIINLPGMMHGILTPAFSSDELILTVICAFSSFFALVMLLRNLPKTEETAKTA